MTAQVGENGTIQIPSEFREADSIVAGRPYELERVGEGEYRIRFITVRPEDSLIDHLRACPVKGFFEPLPRVETTDSPWRSPFEE